MMKMEVHPANVETHSAKLELVLYGTDFDLLEKLKRFSADMPYIVYEPGYGPQAVTKAGLDALWATPMIGVELFGAAPPFPIHEAQVLETPPAQLHRGMPKYGIVGVATAEGDPTTPEFELWLVLSTLLKTVDAFNADHRQAIRRVGILPEDLSLKRLESEKAFRMIREIYEHHKEAA